MGHHAGKPAIPLHRPVTVIGSRSTARIHLMSSTVSKAHALVVHSAGRTYIRDLASRSRVYVNGDQVRDIELSEGDLIKIGSFTFQFKEGRRRPSIPPKTLPQAELNVTGGPIPLPIDQRVLLIGRRPTVDVPLLEESASTAHAVIFEMDGEHYVRDLGSRTGTFVNGVTVHQHKLNPGDVVRVGETDIRYQLGSEAPEMEIPTGAGAGESAGPYALEAPTEELESEPVAPGVEHDTMGGLDLMGQVVSEATARYVEKPATAKPARRDEAGGDAIPLEPAASDEPAESAAAAAAPRVAVSSADSEDLADELLGESLAAAESLSPDEAHADTTARAPEAIAGAAPALASETAEHEGPPAQGTRPSTEADDEEAELQPRRGWRGALPHDDEADEQRAVATDDQTLIEPVVEDEAPEPAASVTPSEPASPTHEVSQDVLRFDQSDKTDSYDSDEGADGGVAVLDQDALDAGARDQSAAPSSIPFEFEEASSSHSDERAEPDAQPLELNLEAGFDVGKAEQPAQPTEELETALEFGDTKESPDQTPDLNFAELARPVEPPPLDMSPEVEELPRIEPPAPLPLINPAAEGPAARPRGRKGRFTKTKEPEAPVWEPAPPTAEELPPPVEIVDATLPTPESALDLDSATGDAALDESAIADALGGNAAAPAADAMTDSLFDLAVEELGAGGSTGEIVEEPAEPQARQAPQVPQAPQAPQVDEAPVAQSKDDTDRFESMIEMDLPGVDEAQSILPARSKVPPPLEVA
jgi:pSer/pThr/pTyr-binding forkhead associated (FHA) protein